MEDETKSWKKAGKSKRRISVDTYICIHKTSYTDLHLYKGSQKSRDSFRFSVVLSIGIVIDLTSNIIWERL
jgi:hypothetical protein